jgi:hypothetical protein
MILDMNALPTGSMIRNAAEPRIEREKFMPPADMLAGAHSREPRWSANRPDSCEITLDTGLTPDAVRMRVNRALEIVSSRKQA